MDDDTINLHMLHRSLFEGAGGSTTSEVHLFLSCVMPDDDSTVLEIFWCWWPVEKLISVREAARRKKRRNEERESLCNLHPHTTSVSGKVKCRVLWIYDEKHRSTS